MILLNDLDVSTRKEQKMEYNGILTSTTPLICCVAGGRADMNDRDRDRLLEELVMLNPFHRMHFCHY